MTELVIRALDERTAPVFDTLPDPLGARGPTGSPGTAPTGSASPCATARSWHAAPGGAAPTTPPPSTSTGSTWPKEEEAGAELLRTAPWQVELEMNLPAGWREDPGLRAAAETRSTAVQKAGYELLVERFLYRWTPEHGLPERPGRLEFRPEPDDAVFFGLLRRIHSATLDAHALTAIEEDGLDRAAQEELDFFHWCPSPREWWQIAHTPEGDAAGIHIPAHNPSGPCVGFIGVVPEQRGHGYAYDLLAECTHHLVEHGAEFVSGATDRGNFPMAANFAKAGYPVVRERLNFRRTLIG